MTRRWVALSEPALALRLQLAHVSAHPPPPTPLHVHRGVPRGYRLRCPRHRGAGPQPPKLCGHPRGLLRRLDGHGRGPQGGDVNPAAHPLGPRSVGPRVPPGSRLVVWPGGHALAVPPPPLEGRRAAHPGRPPAGAPLGPGSPPCPLRLCRCPAGLD